MNDNELNELIEIRDNAPKCTTIGVDRVIDKSVVVDGDGLFWSLMDFNWWCWSPSEKRWELDLNHKPDIRPIRSLSDINTIIQLEQQKRELVKSSDWINVRDELPEKNSEGHALIYRPESYEKQGCKTQIVPMRMVSKMVDATHWMVAPTPQKDLTND